MHAGPTGQFEYFHGLKTWERYLEGFQHMEWREVKRRKTRFTIVLSRIFAPEDVRLEYFTPDN